MDREDTSRFIEVGIRVTMIVREELILKVSEANHVVTTPVFVHELTATLFINVLQSGHMRKRRSMNISANLIEQRLRCRATRTFSCLRFSLHQQDIGITEDGNIVTLVAPVLVIIINNEELY